MLSILNASQLLGRIIPAIASDWIGPELLLLSAELAAGVLAFCWIAVRSTDSLIVWISFFGFVSGMIVKLPAAVLPYVCPVLSKYGTRLGMLYASGGLGPLISTPIATALYSRTEGIWVRRCGLVLVVLQRWCFILSLLLRHKSGYC
jgi:hypothetical protein